MKGGPGAHTCAAPLSSPFALDSQYASDHLNYLCTNWTRSTPLPCDEAASLWDARWLNGEKRFIVTAWWPPNPADFDAFADAGFNLALPENAVGELCSRMTALHGPGWVASHDLMFDHIIETSKRLASLGILTVFSAGNGCNIQLQNASTVAFGNRTGGLVPGYTNITNKAPDAWPPQQEWTGQRAIGKGSTVPELEYIESELRARNVSDRFAGVFLRDDTETEFNSVVAAASWLNSHAKWLIPIVNQVAPGPEALYRSLLFINSPEQYPAGTGCVNGSCAAMNVTAVALSQMNGYAGNADEDARYALHTWPLFFVGAGTSNGSNPDAPGGNVRSDSLVRFMAYAAIAYGAKGLNYYCWGGGIYWYNQNMSLPGRPTPSYQTIKEVNADASAWGDILVGGDYSLSGTIHTGFGATPSNRPSESLIVTSASDALLVGVHVVRGGKSRGTSDLEVAYLFLVDKRLSNKLPALPARNVSFVLHPSVGSASVLPPGAQGRTGFAQLKRKYGTAVSDPGLRRPQWSRVTRGPEGVEVSVETVGGGGAFVRIEALPSRRAEFVTACYAMNSWNYAPGDVSLAGTVGLKAINYAYDAWHHRYRPYAGLELSAGRSFEQGEQTAFILAAALGDAAALRGPSEAQAWALAGFNLLSVEAPVDSAGNAPGGEHGSHVARAVGDLLDWGYSFGFFALLEPRGGSLTPDEIVNLTATYRCHGRFGGFMLAKNVSAAPGPSGVSIGTAAKVAEALRTVGRGRWLLPFASADHAEAALALGEAGVPLAAPVVPPQGSMQKNAQAVAQDIAAQYEPLRAQIARSYVPDPTGNGLWRNNATLGFVAMIDVCSSPSDSLLRFAAFSSLAYGARGLFWQGAGRCAAVGTPKFGLLSSINNRIAGWGNTFVSSIYKGTPAIGYNITRLWGTGYALPNETRPGSAGLSDLVQWADEDLLIAQLGSMGQPATPLLFVLDKRVDHSPGVAAVRQVKVGLSSQVTAVQPLEGDCAAAKCQCGMSTLGSDVVLRLPGGSGQLVALAMRE